MHPARLCRWTAVAVVIAAAVGCGRGNGRVVSEGDGAIDVAVVRPAFTLTGTDGKPFGFRERTSGRLTFLEFGYTHCPDVCPVHMANLAAALAQLPPSDRMRIDVVFVSIDPARDSLPVIRKWLDAFDPKFIGLTGTREALDAAQRSVGFAPAIVQAAAPGAPETEVVTHAAPVLAFTADDSAHFMYPFGTRQSDWARDLPHLLAQGAPAVSVSRAYIVIPAGPAPAALYLSAQNTGNTADTIVAINATELGAVTLHQSMEDASGMMMMHAVAGIAVPAGGSARLAPGGFHGMLAAAGHPLQRGDRIPITVRFSRAGQIRAIASVIGYADVDTATAPH